MSLRSPSIAIRNIGPIKKADISLSDLTILIGPNNSGKSVVAGIIHAVGRAAPRRRRSGPLTLRPVIPVSVVRGSKLVDFFEDPDIIERIRDVRVAERDVGDNARALPPSFVRALARTFDGLFSAFFDSIVENLMDEFGATIDDLVRVSSDGRRMPSKLEIAHIDPAWRLAGTFGRPEPRHTVEGQLPWAELIRQVPQRFFPPARMSHVRPPIVQAREFVGGLAEVVFRGFPTNSYYLPAARSGVLQSHRVIAAAVMKTATRVGLEEVVVPKMSGTISDFVSTLLSIDDDSRGAFDGLATMIERDVLDGAIRIDDSAAYPEISYVSHNVELPLHRTSSMVSELAPLVLYMRRILQRGDRLVIEEPEAHLHPASQLRLARLLSQAVSSGMQVTLTTHSDYLLQSISNAIRATATGQSELFEMLSGPDGLEPRDVEVYLFNRSVDGTTVSDVAVSSSDGISDDEFAAVSEELYRETVILDRALKNG